MKKLTRQVTVSREGENVAVMITMLNQLSEYGMKRVLRAVCAYFKLTVIE